jgi:hypothetical protein
LRRHTAAAQSASAPRPRIHCLERERLFAQFRRAVDRYRSATDRLAVVAGTKSGEFGLCWEETEIARIETACIISAGTPTLRSPKTGHGRVRSCRAQTRHTRDATPPRPRRIPVDEQQIEFIETAALTATLIREGFEIARPIRDRGSSRPWSSTKAFSTNQRAGRRPAGWFLLTGEHPNLYTDLRKMLLKANTAPTKTGGSAVRHARLVDCLRCQPVNIRRVRHVRLRPSDGKIRINRPARRSRICHRPPLTCLISSSG